MKRKKAIFFCGKCGSEVLAAENYKQRYPDSKGPYCQKCRNLMASVRLSEIRSRQTPERRQEIAIKARSMVKETGSSLVCKQWKTIKADPEFYARICNAKSERMKKVWAEYPDWKRSKITTALAGGNKRSVSLVSQELIKEMQDNGIFDGFEQEKNVHGFIPDLVNEEHHLIIEFYGDLYHANPRKFKDPSLFLPMVGRTVEEIWKRDRKRLGALYRYGYRVLIIWECNWRRSRCTEIERIRHALEDQKISFR